MIFLHNFRTNRRKVSHTNCMDTICASRCIWKTFDHTWPHATDDDDADGDAVMMMMIMMVIEKYSFSFLPKLYTK